MTEDDARDTVKDLVGAAAYARLERLVEIVIDESGRQNLIARSTIPTIWTRHVLDSVQLLRFASGREGRWIDIGTGGGFPGLAIAVVRDGPITLVEPRRLRASFLETAATRLGLRHVDVLAAKIENVSLPAAIISARAVAPMGKLLQAAAPCATPATRWLFLRGQVAPEEMAALRSKRGMTFHVEQSLSYPTSSVVVADGRP